MWNFSIMVKRHQLFYTNFVAAPVSLLLKGKAIALMNVASSSQNSGKSINARLRTPMGGARHGRSEKSQLLCWRSLQAASCKWLRAQCPCSPVWATPRCRAINSIIACRWTHARLSKDRGPSVHHFQTIDADPGSCCCCGCCALTLAGCCPTTLFLPTFHPCSHLTGVSAENPLVGHHWSVTSRNIRAAIEYCVAGNVAKQS